MTDIAIFRDLEEAARDAGEALGRAAQPCLFDRIDWYRLVRDDLPGCRPVVIRAREGAARCWIFLCGEGPAATALRNGYGLRFGTVADPAGTRDLPVEGLVRGIRQAGIARFYMGPAAADDPLPKELRRRGWLVRGSPVTVSWRVDTGGMDFAQYWAARPSRLRNTVARRMRKSELEIRILDRFDDAAMDDYESVYDASWKPAEGSPSLIRALARQEGAAGTLRLGLAFHRGQPVAGQLWLVENGVATIHKLAYRDDMKELSAGSILSHEMFRRAIDTDRARLIDFGVGDHAYKAEWMSYKVPLYGYSAYDLLSVSGAVGAARAVGGKIAARLIPA